MLDYLTNWNKSIRYRSFFDQFIIKVNQTLDCFLRKKKEIWNQRAVSLPRKWKKILEKKRKKEKKTQKSRSTMSSTSSGYRTSVPRIAESATPKARLAAIVQTPVTLQLGWDLKDPFSPLNFSLVSLSQTVQLYFFYLPVCITWVTKFSLNGSLTNASIWHLCKVQWLNWLK